MKKYVWKRLLQLIPILFVITFLSFGMMRLAGSDAVMQKMENTGQAVSQEVIDSAREELGLDKPFLTQYFVWLGNLLKGDMGTSYISGKDVFSVFLSKLPATLLLTAVSLLLTVAVSCSAGNSLRGETEQVYGLFNPVLQFCGKQHAQFFCGAASDVFLCHKA